MHRFHGTLIEFESGHVDFCQLISGEACSAFSETPAQALVQIELAKVAWLEAARRGEADPPPRYRPAIYQTGS